MNCLIILTIFLVASFLIFQATSENFDLDSYLRPNYESGANMLRGDLPIAPVQQSWFNTPLDTPQNFVHGFF